MAVGYSWILILITVVVALLVVASNVYILVAYSHPEDKNQAWGPKIIVVFGLSLAVFSILMYPLDIANVHACAANISPSACTYTLPMYELWLASFIMMLSMAFAVIPFTVFYYEADSDFKFFQKIKSAAIWTFLLLLILGLIIGIAYGLAGYVIWNVQLLQSGTAPLGDLATLVLPGKSAYPCLLFPTADPVVAPFPPAPPPGAAPAASPPPPPNPVPGSRVTVQCVANLPNTAWIMTREMKMRVTLLIYIIAIQSIIGWFLFLVFAGVGLLAAPIDWILQFMGRPRSTITKSEYMRRGRLICQRAKECVNMANMLRRQEKDRRWRTNYKRLEREVNSLEEDEYQLERVYPQGEDGESRWVLFMIGFYVTGFMGVIGIILSLAWLAQIIVYMLPPAGPLDPLLNTAFVLLDRVFPLLGVLAFGGFCLYLQAVAMKGNFMLGLNFVIVKLYPMRPGATLVSSLLVNTAIILVMTPAILQFCATAFAVYASNSSIFDIFGVQVGYLQGISWIYANNFFLYCMLAVMFCSGIYMCFRGPQFWSRKPRGKELESIYSED